jgi:hypothetical protein
VAPVILPTVLTTQLVAPVILPTVLTTQLVAPVILPTVLTTCVTERDREASIVKGARTITSCCTIEGEGWFEGGITISDDIIMKVWNINYFKIKVFI